jgi:hypothetical protein
VTLLAEVSLGLRMAVFGLILGGGAWLIGRVGSPTNAYGRGKDKAARALAVPLLVVGVIGLLLWALGQ